ncbi:hypothetical protein Mgra_00007267, partial [Meloidogyne graminicola]
NLGKGKCGKKNKEVLTGKTAAERSEQRLEIRSKNFKNDITQFFKKPEAFIKKKVKELVKTALQKGRDALEAICKAKTGDVLGLCAFISDEVKNLATDLANALCDLSEVLWEKIKEGASDLIEEGIGKIKELGSDIIDGGKDFVNSIIPW